MSNADELKGRLKEAAGDITDNSDLKHEGRKDRAAGAAKDKIDKAADAVTDVTDKAKDKAGDAVDRVRH